MAGAAIPAYLALDGGAYDLMVRHQAALVLWWVLALAFAFGYLPAARPARSARLAAGMFLALLAWTALALLWTESQQRTFDELARVAGYAGIVALVLATVHRRTFRHAAAGLAVALVAIVTLALTSRLWPDLFPVDSIAQVFAGERLLYPLGYWNALAGWCAAAIAMCLALSGHLRGWPRRASLAAVPVCAATLYLTYSRGGIVAAVLGIALVVALARHRWTVALHAGAAIAASALVILMIRGNPAIANGSGTEGAVPVALAVAIAAACCWFVAGLSRAQGVDRLGGGAGAARWLGIGALAVALVIAAAGGPSVTSPVGGGIVESGDGLGGSDPSSRLVGLGGIRGEVWASALRAWGSEPLTGIGPGAFDLWWARDGSGDVRDAHSLYLETLAELGLVGLLLLGAALAVLAGCGLAARRHLSRSREIGAATGLLAAGVVVFFHAGVDWMWEMGAVAAIGLASLALAASAASSERMAGRALGGRRALLVAGALLAGAVQVPGLVATERLGSSEVLLGDGFNARAAELAGDAVDAEPWAARGHALAAFAALASDDLGDALREINRAIDREPTNWRHRFLLLRIELERDDSAAARAALAEVVRLNPGLRKQARGIRDSGLLDESDGGAGRWISAAWESSDGGRARGASP